MAPKGKHVLHGYTPANEPWEIWEPLNPKKLAYRNLKEERCSIFLNAVRKFIPDIDERIDLKMLGTQSLIKNSPIPIAVVTGLHYLQQRVFSQDAKLQ